MNGTRRTFRRPPIRARLALWSTAGLLVVLVIVGVATTMGLRDGLRDRAHVSLEAPFRVVNRQLATHPEMRLRELLDGVTANASRNEVIGQLLDARGKVIDNTGEPATLTPMVGHDALAGALRHGAWHEPRRLTGRTSDDIVVVEPIRSGPRAGDFTVLAQTLAPANGEVDRLIRYFLALGPIVLLTSLLGGWWIARASLRPVDVLTRQAAAIDPQTSDATLAVPPGDDEVSRLAAALNDMLRRLRLEIDRQRRFSADASHELRTPLALMTTNLEVSLRSTTLPEAARPVLESIREDVARLTRIVEDLLVLSRAEARGGVELASAPTDLLDLAVTVVSRFGGKAAARGIELELGGEPVVATVDAHLLGQAIANLVDNAVKFSDAGGHVDVTVTCEDGPTIAVTDRGRGIVPDDLDHVFERFYQADRARHTGGSGLGLAIVESIVAAHGGTIDVDSTLGVGSRFAIRLPVACVVAVPHDAVVAGP